MARQRKTFDPSLKLEVVRMIKDQGLRASLITQREDNRCNRVEPIAM